MDARMRQNQISQASEFQWLSPGWSLREKQTGRVRSITFQSSHWTRLTDRNKPMLMAEEFFWRPWIPTVFFSKNENC
jgi:hypothetical protein